MKIAIALPNWIGDVVMATPTIRAIRKHFGSDARLIGVMRPYVSQVLAGTTWLDESILYERRATNRATSFWSVVRRLRSESLDAMLLLPNSWRFGWLGFLSGARRRVGYARDGRGLLLTDRLDAPRTRSGWFRRSWTPISAIDYYLELAYALGCPPEPRRMELATLPEDEHKTDEIWKRLQLNDADPVIVMNTGSAVGSAKSWPLAYCAELARRIVHDHATSAVLFICGPAERDTVAELERTIGHERVRSMAQEDLSLGVAKACIRRADAVVSTDSGPRHIAHAFDVPTVALFGPIDFRWSHAYHERSIELQHDVPCRPCGKTVCPLGHHECMRGLSVDRVYDALLRVLKNRRAKSNGIWRTAS